MDFVHPESSILSISSCDGRMTWNMRGRVLFLIVRQETGLGSKGI